MTSTRRKRCELAPGELGEALAELDADDLEAALGQRHSRLPRSAADLDEARAWLEPRKRYQIVEHM